MLPAWGLWLAAGVLAAALAVYGWYLLPILKTPKTLALLALRLLFLTGLFGLLLRPSVVFSRMKPVQGTLILAVDRSLSMLLSPPGSPSPPAPVRVNSGKEAPRPGATSRWAWAWSRLSSPAFRERLSQYRVRVLSFGASTTEVEALTSDALAPREETTDFSDLATTLDRWTRQEPVSGILIVSDGIDHSGFRQRLDQTGPSSLALLKQEVPITALGFGTSKRVRDLAVESVENSEYAFVRSTVRVKAVLRVRGYDFKELPVTLKREGELYSAQSARVDRKTGLATAEFDIQPFQVGESIYSVSVPIQEGEMLTENNERHFVLRVLRDKTRMLLISGRPSWELRFFREMVKRHPHFDLVNFNILRTPSDIFAVPEKELSLIPFPGDDLFFKDIQDFDLLVFLDFTHETLPNFAPYIRPEALVKIRDQVNQHGMGVLVIGGEQTFSGSALRNSPLEEIMPVQMPMMNRGFDSEEFRPMITEAGRSHFITTDREGASIPWNSLPPLSGSALIGPPKAGAITLLAHPRARAGGQPVPVAAVWEKGKGRVMLLSTDSSWRWAFSDPSSAEAVSAYHQFWYRAIRWLTRDPETNRITVTSERSAKGGYSVSARVVDDQYRKARGVNVTMTLRDPRGPKLEQAAREISEGQYESEFQTPAMGLYSIEVHGAKGDASLGDAKAVFTDPAAFAEAFDYVPDQPLMERLADLSGGSWVDLTRTDPAEIDWPPPEKQVEEGSREKPLWNTAVMLLILFAAAASEWTLRRRWGLM